VSVRGIAYAKSDIRINERVAGLANEARLRLGIAMEAIEGDDIESFDYAGDGYAQMSDEAAAAICRVARTDGLLLDPVYSAKGMVGLLADVASHRLPRDAAVVFVHTGGYGGIFGYPSEMTRVLGEVPEFAGVGSEAAS
jgi:1-aminocyclopropane-1-carboxylate deaminase/D-cysteine desulfhydrase-like pyridoxal-dependent ACC family enzyme